jgi:hypothetical protein
MMLGLVVNSVEIKWHGGHLAARCSALKCLRFMLRFVNLRPSEAIRDRQLERARRMM